MINAILTGILKLIMGFVSLILTPIDALITQFLPGINQMFSFITGAFNIVGQFFGWIIDATLINTEVISFIILVFTFRLTVPLMVYAIKLAIRWYNTLKI